MVYDHPFFFFQCDFVMHEVLFLTVNHTKHQNGVLSSCTCIWQQPLKARDESSIEKTLYKAELQSKNGHFVLSCRE